MEESNLNALFVEPNAYIQHYNDKECKPNNVKKVIFAEPYENSPKYYLKDDFKKAKCDFCEHDKPKQKPQPKLPFSFDFKNLLPFLSIFGGGKSNTQLNDLISILGKSANGNNTSILGLLQNKELVNGALNLLKGGGLNIFKQKKENQPKAKTTDFQINNYTRVE